MSKIKENKLLVILVLFSIMLISFGVILYSSHNVTAKGIYFRKTYGYIGCSKSQILVLDLTLFNVGDEDMVFFDDTDNLSFDIEAVVVKDIAVKSINKIRNIEVFQCIIKIDVLIYDKVQIKKIKYETDDYVKLYDLGCIDLEKIDKESQAINHGANSDFLNNQYIFTLSSSNTESYTITDIMFSNNRINSINKNFPVNYEKGKTIEIKIGIEYDVDKFDVFILKPVLKFKKLDDTDDYYLFIVVQTRYELPMTYKEIRDYLL